MPESGGVCIQIPFFHLQFVQFTSSLFFAHQILESSSKVIDHAIPDVLVPIAIGIYVVLDVFVGFLDLIVHPFVYMGPSYVSQKN